MSEIESVPNWIYTFLILPIALSFQKHWKLKNRVVKVETKIEELEKLPEKIDTLCTDVSYIKGRIDEYFRNNTD